MAEQETQGGGLAVEPKEEPQANEEQATKLEAAYQRIAELEALRAAGAERALLTLMDFVIRAEGSFHMIHDQIKAFADRMAAVEDRLAMVRNGLLDVKSSVLREEDVAVEGLSSD